MYIYIYVYVYVHACVSIYLYIHVYCEIINALWNNMQNMRAFLVTSCHQKMI